MQQPLSIRYRVGGERVRRAGHRHHEALEKAAAVLVRAAVDA